MRGPTFAKQAKEECQPDLAYYIGSDEAPNMQRPPKNNQPVDIEIYGPPTLAVEIAATTLSDDLGNKRLLYERLGVREYWVINVKDASVVAFAIADGGSREIQVSKVVRDLPMSVIEEALRRSATKKESAINRWLLEQFS